MGNASNVCGGERPTSALALFENLSALNGASSGSWLDCATRLEIAADRAAFAGQTAGQVQDLRDRADESRRNALSASLVVAS
jgi:hypothetical protein